MKEIAKKFFDENTISLRINYRPLTEWLMTLSKISNRQEFYNELDLLDKDFSTEKCKAIFQDNYEIAKRVLSSSSVEELENIEAIPSEIVEYFRNYKALDDKCVIRPLLARGALYYDGVVYEMFHSKMESAIMGGGHGTMFGVTRVGASFGLERLLMCINKNKNTKVSTFYTQEETFFQRRIGNDLDTKIEQVGIRNENVKQLKLEKIHR